MREGFRDILDIGLKNPLEGRLTKPRSSGLTMVIDKGLGPGEIHNLLEVNSEYIDFIKFSFGTSLIYPEKILKEKIKIIKDYDIYVYPGGTLFEIAITQKRLDEYLYTAKHLGFTALEISNGTIFLQSKLREEAIAKAKSLGFTVLTEVGKKDPGNSLILEDIKVQIKEDLSVGADYVIIEGRESGKDIAIYNSNGNIKIDKFRGILNSVQGNEDILIWEAPLKKQQTFFIKELGPNVSLGNIHPGDILALEALRRGLRGDTFKATLSNEFAESGGKGSIVGA